MRDDGGARHLQPGIALPSVPLFSTKGTEIDVAALAGRNLIIVYPWTGRPGRPDPPGWDDIPGAHGSTPELEGFRNLHARFARLGVSLFGLSRQATDYQREFVTRLALPFPVLSDAEGRFALALRLPSFTSGGEIYLKRLTLLLKDGRIERLFYPVADPRDHAAEVVLSLEQQA